MEDRKRNGMFLEKCPFCGRNVDVVKQVPQNDGSEMFAIQCCNCWLTMLNPIEERLVDNWNARFTEWERKDDIGIIKLVVSLLKQSTSIYPSDINLWKGKKKVIFEYLDKIKEV